LTEIGISVHLYSNSGFWIARVCTEISLKAFSFCCWRDLQRIEGLVAMFQAYLS